MILWCPEGGMYAATGQARRPAPAATFVPAVVEAPPAPDLRAAS